MSASKTSSVPQSEVIDVSIVVVSFNTRDLTRDCLQSVYGALGQLRAQVIVVDNQSADGSAEMVTTEFPQVHLIRSKENQGFAGGNNRGIEISRGQYLLLLNSDTIVLGDVIANSLRYMDEHPDVGVFGCRVLNPDRSMQATCFRFPSLLNIAILTSGLERLGKPRWCGRQAMRDWQRDSTRDVDVVTGCYMMVRREAMEQVGPLDESFFFCGEETDWCRRFKAAGWKVRFAPVGEIIHIGNASGRQLKARRDLLLTQGLVRYHRKHGGVVPAAIAWVMLFGFNLSRMAWWGLHHALTRRSDSHLRHRHFFCVVKEFGSAWPRRQRVEST